MNGRAVILFLLMFLMLACGIVCAQGFSGDARKIGMGGIGYSENITAKMIEDERNYSSYVIPFGILQMIGDRDHFDPDDKDQFDPILGMEYAANPIHLVFDRNPGGPRGKFVSDVINGELSSDLNTYRGFVPTGYLLSEGLVNPSWGKTVKVYKRPDGTYQGFYVGLGPYLSAKAKLNIDEGLIDILSSSTDVYRPDQSFTITDRTSGQLALAITGGYRSRFALPGRLAAGKSKRDGIYVGMNYHYLKGYRYENPDTIVRFDTDSSGDVVMKPTTAPVLINYASSDSGSGFALDFGVGAVVDRWEFGFAANGVGNRINWDDLYYKEFRLESLLDGGDFIDRRVSGPSTQRVELPVDYTWNAGYNETTWSATVEITRGFQGSGFHGGAEYRLSRIEFRGGLRYGLERWHPCGGLGVNVTRRFSVDVALFGTTTNIERDLKAAMAFSLRFKRS